MNTFLIKDAKEKTNDTTKEEQLFNSYYSEHKQAIYLLEQFPTSIQQAGNDLKVHYHSNNPNLPHLGCNMVILPPKLCYYSCLACLANYKLMKYFTLCLLGSWIFERLFDETADWDENELCKFTVHSHLMFYNRYLPMKLPVFSTGHFR